MGVWGVSGSSWFSRIVFIGLLVQGPWCRAYICETPVVSLLVYWLLGFLLVVCFHLACIGHLQGSQCFSDDLVRRAHSNSMHTFKSVCMFQLFYRKFVHNLMFLVLNTHVTVACDIYFCKKLLIEDTRQQGSNKHETVGRH